MVHKNVRSIREAKGITKTHIANMLNMSLMGYTHIESGSVRLDVERFKLIANLLDMDLNIFFDTKLTESVVKELNSKKTG